MMASTSSVWQPMNRIRSSSLSAPDGSSDDHRSGNAKQRRTISRPRWTSVSFNTEFMCIPYPASCSMTRMAYWVRAALAALLPYSTDSGNSAIILPILNSATSCSKPSKALPQKRRTWAGSCSSTKPSNALSRAGSSKSCLCPTDEVFPGLVSILSTASREPHRGSRQLALLADSTLSS